MSETSTLKLPERFPWPRLPFDPPPEFGRLREECPVVRVISPVGDPLWLVTRYDDVRAILSDPRVSADNRKPGFPNYGIPVVPGERPFLRMDPPEHTNFRRALNKNFLVKQVESMRPRIQSLVDTTIDAMLAAPQRPVDLVRCLALPVPSTVLSWILGVKAADQEFFNGAAEALMKNARSPDSAAQQKAFDATRELREYIGKIAKEKASLDNPGADIIGQMVIAEREGSITRQDTINTGYVFIIAGHDTTANMTALGTLTLLQHPEQLAELRKNPELIPDAIEELLRYLTIVHLIIQRVATEDIEIGGVVIPAGEGIVPLNFSANRDDAHFPDAATFDIHRKARDHFAFGYGVHQCIGQPLARVELQVIFETLLRRIPRLRLAVPIEQVPFKYSAPIHGVTELQVTW